MANHPNREPSGAILREDYVVGQVGFLMLEISKMIKLGPLHDDYEKARKSARRAAIRAAKTLDTMSPMAGAKQLLSDIESP